jgi:uncharacterized membrane protein
MSTVAVTQLIEAPADDLWRIFTDLPARVVWLSTAEGVEVLTKGQFGAGTRWRETRPLPDGGAVIEQFEVDEATAPCRLTVTSPGAGVAYRTTYTFTAVRTRRRRDCTAVTVVQEAVPTAPYGRVLALFFGGLAARTVEGALRRELADLAAATRVVDPGPATAA